GVPGEAGGERAFGLSRGSAKRRGGGSSGGRAKFDPDGGEVPGDVGGAGEERVVAVIGAVEFDPAGCGFAPLLRQHAAIERDARAQRRRAAERSAGDRGEVFLGHGDQLRRGRGAAGQAELARDPGQVAASEVGPARAGPGARTHSFDAVAHPSVLLDGAGEARAEAGAGEAPGACARRAAPSAEAGELDDVAAVIGKKEEAGVRAPDGRVGVSAETGAPSAAGE